MLKDGDEYFYYLFSPSNSLQPNICIFQVVIHASHVILQGLDKWFMRIFTGYAHLDNYNYIIILNS